MEGTNLNTEEKSGRRISALDISVILLIVAILVLALVRLGVVDRISFRGTDCDVTVRITKADASFAANISEGDKVYFEDGTLLGTVVSASVSPSYFRATGTDVATVSAKYPESEYVDVSVVVRASLAWKDGSRYTLGGKRIIAGAAFTLDTAAAVFECVVSSIEEVAG